MKFVLLFIVILKLVNITKEADCGSEAFTYAETPVLCYDVKVMDDYPVIDEEHLPENGIYLIDPSCKGGLNIREACTVEAAAKMNPERQINVLFTGPVEKKCQHIEPLSNLQVYRNVRLWRIYVDEFSNRTGLEHLLKSSVINGAPYPILYALELLKYITMYKFGGIYMDLDMLATRSFDDLPNPSNFVGIEEHVTGELGSAVLAFSTDNIGRKFAQSIISLLRKGELAGWSYGEIDVLKESIERNCGKIPFNNTKKGLSFTCQKLFTLYSSKFFYPISCESSKMYFGKILSINNISQSITQKICNSVTYELPLIQNSTYALLMKYFCPKMYKTVLKYSEHEAHYYNMVYSDSNTLRIESTTRRDTATTPDFKEGADKKPINREKKWYMDRYLKKREQIHNDEVVNNSEMKLW